MKSVISIIVSFFFCVAIEAQPIVVSGLPSTTVKSDLKLYPTESLGGKETWRKITVGEMKDFISPISVAASLPQLPTSAKIHYNSASKVMYYYQGDAWYYQGDLIRATTPQDTTYIVSGQVVKIKYINATWYNTTTKSYWDYNYTTGGWRNRDVLNLDSLLSTNNNWTGKNRFSDSLTADKGLKSGGPIDTKGLNTEGGATKSAATFNGVNANKVETITANKTLDGTSNVLLVRPTTIDINLSLPPPSLTNKGWSYTIKKDNAEAFYVVIKDYLGTILKRIWTKDMSVKAESDGLSWSIY